MYLPIHRSFFQYLGTLALLQLINLQEAVKSYYVPAPQYSISRGSRVCNRSPTKKQKNCTLHKKKTLAVIIALKNIAHTLGFQNRAYESFWSRLAKVPFADEVWDFY